MSTEATAWEEDAPLWSFLLPWLAAAVADSVFALRSPVSPAPDQFAVEFAVLTGMGWAQWRFASGWLRSRLAAAALLALFGTFAHLPEGVAQGLPFLVGVVVTLIALLRCVHRFVPVPALLASVVAVAVVIGAHRVDRAVQGGAMVDDAGEAASGGGLARTGTSSGGVPVIVISVDTLRADDAMQMDSVRRLAARGRYWERAMSTSSWTLPSLASLQTGLMPSGHGAGCLEDGHCQGLSRNVPTLAETLWTNGWDTAAVVSNPWAGRAMGFARGFASFVDEGEPASRLLVGGVPRGPHGQDDARTIDRAIAWLDDAADDGFYLWVHLMGPHAPYLHSPIEKLRTLDPVVLRSVHPLSDARKRELRDAYHDEVSYTDMQVMRLLDAMQGRGLLDRAAVVFTADHGEEFWDHGGVEHGHSHHGEITDVPLVLLAPRLEAARGDGVASLVDIVPTILRIADLPTEGLDLRGEIPTDRIATAWGGLVQRLDCSARNLGARLIVAYCSRESYARRLYDLATDPAEHIPLQPAADDPLVRAVAGIRAPAKRGAASVPSERLRGLGYLQ